MRGFKFFKKYKEIDDWTEKLKPGDVILFGNREVPRTVLEVSEPVITYRSGIKYKRFAIYLTIKRCSWTTRPYTLYWNHEMRRLAKPTKAKRDISIPFFKQMLISIDADKPKDSPLLCWDVADLDV